MSAEDLSSLRYMFVRNPFLLTLERRRPNYRYYEIALSLKSVVGALHSVTAELSQARINIVSSFLSESIYKNELEDVSCWFAFIEVPKTVPFKRISERLLNLEVVLDMRCEEMGKADCFDKFLFPLSIYEDRVINLTASTLRSMIEEIVNLLTRAGGEIILYRQGLAAGAATYDKFPMELESHDEELAFMENLLKALGWGIVKCKSLDPVKKSGSIKLYESVEAMRPMDIKCNLIRGYLTGILRKIYEDESIKLEEVRCRSMGDTYCEFKFA